MYTTNSMNAVNTANLSTVLQPNLQSLLSSSGMANTLAGNVQAATSVATPTLQSAPPSDATNYRAPTQASLQPTTVTNNVSTISQGYDQVLASTVTAIKAALAQAKQQTQQSISSVPQQYDKLRNAAYGQTLAAVPVLRENLANIGTSQQSGYSKSQELALNTDLQNRLNDLNMEQQNVINEANMQIQQLEAQGMTQEAQAAADVAQSKLQAIIQEQNRIDEATRQNEQFEYQKLRDTMSDTQWERQFGASEEQRSFENAMTGDQFAFQKEQANIQNQLAQGTLDMQRQAQAWEQAYQTGVFDYQKARDLVSDDRYSQEWQQALNEFSYQKEQDRIGNELAQGQFALAKEQQGWEQKYQEGMFNYNKERDLVGDARYTDEWKLTLDKFALDKAQQTWDNEYQQGTFDYQKERDLLGDSRYTTEWQQKLDEWLFEKESTNKQIGQQDKQIDMAAKQQEWENAYQEGKFDFEKERAGIEDSQWYSELNQKLNEFNANKDLSEREMALKETSTSADLTQQTMKQYTDYIDTAFAKETLDELSGKATGVSYDAAGIAEYLNTLYLNGVDAKILEAIASKYGVLYAEEPEETNTTNYQSNRLQDKLQ